MKRNSPSVKSSLLDFIYNLIILHVVVKEGVVNQTRNNTYYIANRSSSDGVGSEENPTLFSDDSSLRWAQFTPAEFKSFEEDSKDLGLTSIGEFKPREFTVVWNG